MRQFTKYLAIFLFSSSVSVAMPGPRSMEPSSAPAAIRPKGHTNLEVYGIECFTVCNTMHLDKVSTPKFKTFAANPIPLMALLTGWMCS
ncbi:hypothetical protein PGH42_00010 [Legionella pneumophila]|nr:hypothetical protein PGH42_00010 [Legionella pneumophila]